MKTDISLDRACFIALILETFNLGIFTVLFGATVQFILKKRITNANRLLLPVLCLIWLLSMAHWIIDIARARTAFLDTPAGAIVYYGDVSNPLEIAKTAVYVCITLTGDFFMIYRCFVVYNRKWAVVALPVSLWFGTGVSGFGATHSFELARRDGVFFQASAPWVTSFFSLSLSLNVICTGAIAYRILGTRMAMHKHNAQNSRVYSALIIFLESAAIYSSSLTVLLVLYVLGTNAQYIVLDVVNSLIGITFSMILLRLAMANSATELDSLASLRARNRGNASSLYPMTNVMVSRVIEVGGTDSFTEQAVSDKTDILPEHAA